MSKMTTAELRPSAGAPALVGRAHALHIAITKYCRTVAHDMTDTYRPERHYMRGPGPKWREKHTQSGIDSPHLIERRNVPCWRCTILAALVIIAIASSVYPMSTAPVQSPRSADSEDKAAAPSSPCDARHPAKGANAPIGQCHGQRTD